MKKLLPAPPNAELDAVKIESAPSEDREELLASLRNEFAKEPLYKEAASAYRRLHRAGCDIIAVQAYLSRIVGYRPGNVGNIYYGPDAQKLTRRIPGIARRLQAMAEEIARCRSIWGYWGRMAEANCIDIPEELENIAERLSNISDKGLAEYNPQRDAILDLLVHVQTSTGRPHYTEVSVLINAERVWRALKHNQPLPEFKHDVAALKMIMQRHKKRKSKQVA